MTAASSLRGTDLYLQEEKAPPPGMGGGGGMGGMGGMF